MSIDSDEYPEDRDDLDLEIFINPHCRHCGWIYPTESVICPMCGQTRPEYDHYDDEEY